MLGAVAARRGGPPPSLGSALPPAQVRAGRRGRSTRIARAPQAPAGRASATQDRGGPREIVALLARGRQIPDGHAPPAGDARRRSAAATPDTAGSARTAPVDQIGRSQAQRRRPFGGASRERRDREYRTRLCDWTGRPPAKRAVDRACALGPPSVSASLSAGRRTVRESSCRRMRAVPAGISRPARRRLPRLALRQRRCRPQRCWCPCSSHAGAASRTQSKRRAAPR